MPPHSGNRMVAPAQARRVQSPGALKTLRVGLATLQTILTVSPRSSFTMHTRLALFVLLVESLVARGIPAPASPNGGTHRTPNVRSAGGIINHCVVPGVVALTFDDGPYVYTNHVLDLLDQHKAKATFFVNGDNYAHNIDDPSSPWFGVLKRMIGSGHQIGSHTWSHVDLSAAASETRRQEVQTLEQALVRIIGKAPTYLRPPYASCSSECLSDMEQLGYRVVNFDADTLDYLHQQPGEIQGAINNFAAAFDSVKPNRGSILVLSHDVHQQTAEALVPFMLKSIEEAGYKAVTVGECLGDPADNWYRSL
ncbi:hypothetical protein VTK26DRAFT_3996 [Humicola hyalothermophila]